MAHFLLFTFVAFSAVRWLDFCVAGNLLEGVVEEGVVLRIMNMIQSGEATNEGSESKKKGNKDTDIKRKIKRIRG